MTETRAPTEPSRLKYLTKSEIMEEIAAMVGISDYDPSRVSDTTRHACFTRNERRQIYDELVEEIDEELTEKDSSELLRKELTPLIMRAIGEELDSAYIYEFTRTDLQKIHRELSERQLD